MLSQPFRKVTLPNGMRIILVPREGMLSATVLVSVQAGTEYEAKELNGISHFLEHMMFKGTISRPRPEIIAEELDALGAQYNAFTAAESTSYYAKTEIHKLPQIIELLTDIYLNPLFIDAEIEKERGVMVQEINMYEDNPSEYAARLFPEVLYGNQPAGWSMADEKRIIALLNREDFAKYRGDHYVASKTIIVVAGGFDEGIVLQQIESLVGSLPTKPAIKKPPVLLSPLGPQVKLVTRDSSQSHFVLGARSFSFDDPRRPALKVLCNIMGGGMSSRLWLRVREEMGAAYEVAAYAETHSDHGNCGIYVGSDHEKFKPVMEAIMHEMQQVRDVLVPEKELQKAKDHMVGNFILNLEGSDDLAEYYLNVELRSKELVPPEAIIEKIHLVTAEEVREVAQTLFKPENLHFVMVGPESDEEMVKNLLVL